MGLLLQSVSLYLSIGGYFNFGSFDFNNYYNKLSTCNKKSNTFNVYLNIENNLLIYIMVTCRLPFDLEFLKKISFL